ncbi:hypothetical protein CkaCkLH20_01027 [Colletotrichum karsti]|uniref:Uncharacterized protein n=1 Tax=Colletotrichum karsti TaxID=1095194 RepID=A0A9P6LQN5_9PEZI|nr:uncharacterized protein CkaCkLH20_01027 [Colletotrichum karsti]KAF9881881.1 hypothetical protein CkaCkLH20_01027 [Colletotrichum karsti]
MIHFFDLPREVRDMIYVDYVFIQGGYILNFDSNKLRGANGSLIDLTLMLTCKTIAKEMKGVALSSNTLNFSTELSEEHRRTAGRFGELVKTLYNTQGTKMNQIYPNFLSIPDDLWRKLSEIDPKFAPYVDLIRRRPHWNDRRAVDNVGPPGSCGETPSVFRRFVRSALQTLVSHRHCFDAQEFENFERGRRISDAIRLEKLTNLNPDLWAIPSAQEVELMISSMGKGPNKYFEKRWLHGSAGYQLNHVKHRYSAAAVAIRFLRSLPKDTRSSIRRIVLDEDWSAVAFAECHAQGLIPFCQENPHLRVERRVSMWRTILQTMSSACDTFTSPHEGAALGADQISHSVAVWILEALELEPAGMPLGSYTMVLDGDWTISEIFQRVVRRDAAWQAAVDVCLERGLILPVSWDVRRADPRNITGMASGGVKRSNKWYLFEGFPQAVEDIVAGRSVVKCAFELADAWGDSYDVEKLAEEHKHWTLDDWKAGWFVREKESFEPDPPSPSWLQLLCDNTWEAAPVRYDFEQELESSRTAREIEREIRDTWDETSWDEA